ncbi:MAG: thiol reductant ABC exporter subunit CydD [Stappiaceae bacterium]
MAAEKASKTDQDADTSKRFLSALVEPVAGRLRLAGLLLTTADALWIAQAYLIADLCSELLMGSDLSTLPDFLPNFVLFLLLAIIRVLVVHTAEGVGFRCSDKVRQTARRSLIDRAGHPVSQSNKIHSGELAVIASSQVEALDGYIRGYLPVRIRLTLTPAIIILVVLPVSWIAAILLIVAGPIIPFFMALIGSGARKASEKHLEEMQRLGGFLLDRLQGITTLRLLGALGRTEGNVYDASNRFRQRTMAVLRIAFLSSTILEFFAALGVALVAVYVGFSLLGTLNIGNWGTPLSYKAGFFILLITPDFFAPFRAFATAFHDKAAAQAAASRLCYASENLTQPDDCRTPGHNVAASGETTVTTSAPALALVGVKSGFEGRSAGSGIDFRVTAGERIALMGPSGSGKSTILAMIMGFHQPISGEIFVDGRPLKVYTASEWQKRSVLIGQFPHLFHGSLRKNLSFGNMAAEDQELIEALTRASADDLFEKLPAKLDTQIGENGFGLSIGEQRRIAIARALLKPAGLVLADEPTADLDRDNAQKVLAGLQELASGKTMINASHDQIVRNFVDRVLVLKDGQLKELVAG